MKIWKNCGRLSSVQLVPLQAPKHRPIISPHPVEQTEFRRGIKDNGLYIRLYKFVPGTSTEQVVDKGIRQKSTKEWTHSLTAVPFVRGHRSVFPSDSGVYTRHPTFVTATFTRCPTGGRKKNSCLNGLRSEGVKPAHGEFGFQGLVNAIPKTLTIVSESVHGIWSACEWYIHVKVVVWSSLTVKCLFSWPFAGGFALVHLDDYDCAVYGCVLSSSKTPSWLQKIQAAKVSVDYYDY